MRRVVFATDSLGAPRTTPEICTFNGTWPYMVSQQMPEIECLYLTEHGLHTRRLGKKQIRTLFQPDIVIMQVGLVDCAPRVFTEKQKAAVAHAGTFGRLIHRFVHRHYARLTVIRNKSYVSPGEFKSNLERLLGDLEGSTVYAIAIAPPCREFIARSPLIKERQVAYNEILEKVFSGRLIDPYQGVPEAALTGLYGRDYYHLSEVGTSLVVEAVEGNLLDALASLDEPG